MPLYRTTFAAIGKKVDREKGLISDVALITTGCARGHGLLVDDETLSTVKAACDKFDSGLKVKFNVNTFEHGPGAIAGVVPKASLRIDKADGVLRGDLSVNKDFASADYLYSLAENQGDTFGLSIDFNCNAAEVNGLQFARCSEIYAVTIVDQPAANPSGLWAVKPEPETPKQKTTMALSAEDKQEMQTIMAEAVRPLATKMEALEAKFSAPAGVNLATVTAAEKKDAGVDDDDDDETMSKKVEKYRAGLSKPVTMKDLVTFMSRKVGANPAPQTSATGAGNTNDGKTAFARKVDELTATLGNKGAAFKAAITSFPKLYNEHCKEQAAKK